MLNHNIFNKILHIKAKLEWLDKMKLINRNYYKNYIYHNGRSTRNHNLFYYTYKYHQNDILQINNYPKAYRLYDYPYIDYSNIISYRRSQGHSYIKLVNNKSPLQDYSYLLPKRFHYSSGLNNINGYK